MYNSIQQLPLKLEQVGFDWAEGRTKPNQTESNSLIKASYNVTIKTKLNKTVYSLFTSLVFISEEDFLQPFTLFSEFIIPSPKDRKTASIAFSPHNTLEKRLSTIKV